MTFVQRDKGNWLRRAQRVLAALCCLLTFAAGMPDPTCWVRGAPAVVPEAEGEERLPNDENDEPRDEERGKSEEGLFARNARRLARPAENAQGWLAHLSHYHGRLAGHALPIASPFERGAPLSLRC